MQVTTKGRLEN